MYSTKPITVGVLFVGDNIQIQVGDIVPADLISMASLEYMSVLPSSEDHLKALATPMTFVYISESGVGPYKLTGGAHVAIQSSLKDAPKLDILVIPGPPPTYLPNEATKNFLIKAHESGTTILSICTGILAAAGSGILDGKVATGPLGVLPRLRELFPAVKWQGTRRFEKAEGDGHKGEIWSSGGVYNSIDLSIAFLRDKFVKEVAEAMIANAGVSERSVEYTEVEKSLIGVWIE